MQDKACPLILLVDDVDDGRAMMADLLTCSGYRVAEAADGRTAVERASELLPDAVVMDLSLPVMDGWAATRELKADPRTCDIAVIALSGRIQAAHERRARDAGCDDFLTKPCPPGSLLASLRAVLARRSPW